MHSDKLQACSTESCAQPPRRVVLTLGLSQPLGSAKLEPFKVLHAQNVEDALRVLAERDVAVLLLGPGIALPETLDILTRRASEFPVPPSVTTIVSCAGPEPDLLQKFVDAGQIFYLARGEISSQDLRNLILCGTRRLASMASRNCHPLSPDAKSTDCLLDLCSRLPMQTDLASAGRLLIETGRELLRANLVQCFVYDQDAEILTPADASESERWTYSAASGLVAFVARTGEPICLDHVGSDPRYDSDIDAPAEMNNACFLAHPIRGLGESPAGVLTAVRSGKQASFSDEEIRLMELLAEYASPTFNQILLQNRVQALLTNRASGSEANSGIFRQEALDYHVRGWDQQGDVLKVLPAWLRQAFWAVLAVFLASLLGLTLFLYGVRNSLGKGN